MNLKDYISSGILEAYVLGELDHQEKAALEKNLLVYPELRQELARVEQTQHELLQRLAINPPADVKRKLFERVQVEKKEGRTVRMTSDRRYHLWKLTAAASFAFALLSLFVAYQYWNKWRSVSQELTALVTQNQRIANDYNQVNEQLDNLEHDLQVINNPSFKRVIMTGTANAPGATASVYWNEATNEVYVGIHNLKALAADNQYQLWAIIDGKPVDAGVFDDNVSHLVKMKSVSGNPVTFAVTIEPRGGKQTPTLETMQVAGNVRS